MGLPGGQFLESTSHVFVSRAIARVLPTPSTVAYSHNANKISAHPGR